MKIANKTIRFPFFNSICLMFVYNARWVVNNLSQGQLFWSHGMKFLLSKQITKSCPWLPMPNHCIDLHRWSGRITSMIRVGTISVLRLTSVYLVPVCIRGSASLNKAIEYDLYFNLLSTVYHNIPLYESQPIYQKTLLLCEILAYVERAWATSSYI